MLKGGIEHTQPIFRGCSWPERRARSRYFGEEGEKASHVDKPAGTMHSVERRQTQVKMETRELYQQI